MKVKSFERFTRDPDGKVDEVVVGVPVWLHVERMRKRTYWMQVGDLHIWTRLRKDGSVKSISIYDDESGELVAQR